MRKLFLFLAFLMPLSLFSIEISLEENRAESGTVGYVDIVKIFNRFAVNYRKDFDKSISEKQKIVDDRKTELNFFKSQKEKLNFEYQLAKVYDDFNKEIMAAKSISTDTIVSNSTETVDVELSSTQYSGNLNISTVSVVAEAPYIVMPGVGKIPLSSYKFSVSSSPMEILRVIEDVDKKISELEKNITDMKNKFDDELSKKAAKDNEYILKKIYNAIEEVAKNEGVSVVVDKKNVLFGRKTVDLTDKVIKNIEEQ